MTDESQASSSLIGITSTTTESTTETKSSTTSVPICIRSASDPQSSATTCDLHTPTLRSQSAPVDDDDKQQPLTSPNALRQPSRITRMFQSLRQASGLRQSSGSTHTETALCPICYCNEPLSKMYTVSEQCKHRFCQECLAGWITTLVVEGKVNALACPFDAAMISSEEKEALEQWTCGTCTMKNPKLSSQCCACSVPQNKWQCTSCTMYNVRPVSTSPIGRSAVASPDHVSIAVAVTVTDTESKLDVVSTLATTTMEAMSVVCSCCSTPDRVLPPPVHPTIEGKCGVTMQLHDVQQLCLPDVVAKYERFAAMLADPNNRDCPNPQGCTHRQIGSASSPQMICAKCQYEYCYEHSNAHPNNDCQWYERKIRAEVMKTKQAVQAMGTRPCPYCKVDTLKNSGCNHMTCSQCHNEWCWLCNKGINGNVQWHFDPRNVMGCGGMQMSTNATTGCAAAVIRRLLHVVNFLVGGVLCFVVGLLASITTAAIVCLCVPCLLFAALRGTHIDGDLLQTLLLGFGGLYGFGPALALCLLGLSLATALWAGLLPLFIGLSVREHCLGRSTTAILNMLFLPFVLHYEEWTMWMNG